MYVLLLIILATLKRDIFSQAMLMLYVDDHARWGHASWMMRANLDYTTVGVTKFVGDPYSSRKIHFIFTEGVEMAKLQDTNVRTAPSSATDTRATALANLKQQHSFGSTRYCESKVTAVEFELQNHSCLQLC